MTDMAPFNLHIDTDNAAFGESDEEALPEVARLLRQAADEIADGIASGDILDANGNSCGEWSFE